MIFIANILPSQQANKNELHKLYINLFWSRQSMFRPVFNSSTVKDDDITEEKILLQVEDDDNNEELLETVEFIDTNQTSSKLLPNEEEPRISARVVADEDELFGQTIAAELRRIPSSKKKMKIKADMYRLLYENESDE